MTDESDVLFVEVGFPSDPLLKMYFVGASEDEVRTDSMRFRSPNEPPNHARIMTLEDITKLNYKHLADGIRDVQHGISRSFYLGEHRG
jgi:hypothetical protein